MPHFNLTRFEDTLGFLSIAHHEEQIIGFVNMIWDGGIHGFLLDTIVNGACQRQGIGGRLVQVAGMRRGERSD